MNRPNFLNFLTSTLVCLLVSVSATGLAKTKNTEEMMWRGVILMEAIEKHQYDISPSKKLGWRHGMKNNYKSQRATIQVISADPLRSGDMKLSGTVYVEKRDEEIFEVRPPASWCTHSWVLNKDTRRADGSSRIRNNQLRITFAKKSHIDAAQAIRDAIGKCGTDPDCLAKVSDQFKGVVEDQSRSFPVKLVVQCFPSCRDVIQTHSLRKSGRNCRNEEKTERDDSRDIRTELCVPMMFEMDGTYTRGKGGDRITASFSKNGRNPYKAFDGEEHPIEWWTRCTVNLTNGPPEVRIYRLTDDAPPKDITDKEEKVLVGEMVRLQACVVGKGLGQETGRKWDIPGENIKSWEADRDNGPMRKDLTDEDFKKGSIRFACVDGGPGGQNKTVTFSVVFADAELKGKTQLKVYEPTVEVLEFDCGDYVGIGLEQGGGCELTPGKGHESLGIKWKSKVTMPKDFGARQHCVQFVQVFSGNNWFLERVGSPFYEWRMQYEVGMLDTSYPYSGTACGAKETIIQMRDNPGAPLSLMASGYVHDRFETYLMFRPGAPVDLHSVWVPLKRVDWAWKGAVRENDPYGDPDRKRKEGCEKRYKLITNCTKPPASFNPRVQDTILYPEWKGCYVKERDKPKVTGITTQDPEAWPPAQAGAGWTCP